MFFGILYIHKVKKAYQLLEKLTWQALGHIVLGILTKYSALDLKHCVGVVTDDRAVIVSEDCGALTRIKNKYATVL